MVLILIIIEYLDLGRDQSFKYRRFIPIIIKAHKIRKIISYMNAPTRLESLPESFYKVFNRIDGAPNGSRIVRKKKKK